MPPSEPLSREVLARRLSLLLDVVPLASGERATFEDLHQFLTQRGVSLSRARWTYMVSGTGRRVTDYGLLTAIAEFFEIAPAFLLEEQGELPARINAQLEFVQMARRKQVRLYATRMLGDVSPELLQELMASLQDEDDAPGSR